MALQNFPSQFSIKIRGKKFKLAKKKKKDFLTASKEERNITQKGAFKTQKPRAGGRFQGRVQGMASLQGPEATREGPPS